MSISGGDYGDDEPARLALLARSLACSHDLYRPVNFAKTLAGHLIAVQQDD